MPDELLDVVNSADRIIGQELRTVVHQRGLLHRGIHVFLFTADGKLLVQKRSRQRETFPSALDCSVSEHVKTGESYREAVVRGLAEELGIRHANFHALIKFKMDYGPNDVEICQLYEGSVDPAMVHFDTGEVEGVEYHSLDDLEMLIQRGKVAFSGWFIQLTRWYLGKPSEVQVLRQFHHKQYF
jgi:isopentenyl-diphosphate delta-isomerase type 1